METLPAEHWSSVPPVPHLFFVGPSEIKSQIEFISDYQKIQHLTRKHLPSIQDVLAVRAYSLRVNLGLAQN